MSVLPLYKESMHKVSALPESAPSTPADYYCHLLYNFSLLLVR